MKADAAIAWAAGIVLWEARLPDFAFTSISDDVEGMLGYPAERWLEPGFWASVIHPEDREDAVTFLFAQTMAGQPHDFDYRAIAADGSVLWIRDIVLSVDEGPSGAALRGLMMNISGRRRVALTRHQAIGTDLPDGWGQTTLVRSLATELGAPLRALLDTAGDGEARPLVRQARALLEVIEAGQTSQPETDGPACAREAVLLKDLLAATSDALAMDRAPTDLALVDGALDARIVIHVPSLRRILMLLFINAARHAGETLPRATIDTVGTDLRLRLDGGTAAAGADARSVPIPMGIGQRQAREQALILAHVATLTDAMGGTLRMRTEPGRLAEVELMLPFEWADRPQAGLTPRLRVLYAEDDVINAQVMSELLKLRGIETEIAINGRDAVEIFGEDEFDLVLMDVRMPIMDGIEATNRIRADEALQRRRRTPIFGISAHALANDVARCLAAGMDAHMAKPVRLEELSELIDRFVPDRLSR